MHKKTVTYKDFDNNERTEDLYFNMTKTEMTEFALELPDGVSDTVNKDPKNMDVNKAASKIANILGKKGVFNFIKDLVLKSYGVRKDDGRRFAKTDENGRPLSIEFAQTMAFETIMEEFRTNDIAASDFINALIPVDIADKMSVVQK